VRHRRLSALHLAARDGLRDLVGKLLFGATGSVGVEIYGSHALALPSSRIVLASPPT
jgi:hypothetical protein